MKMSFDLQRFTESVEGTSGHDKNSVSASDRIIYGYGGNDTIYNFNYADVTINGGDGADSIVSGIVNRPSNNVAIVSGEGNDTVSLGDGNDVYIYSGGNDLIQNYSSADSVQVDAGISVTNMATISSNVIITTTEGNITLKGGKGKTLNLTDDSHHIVTFAQEKTILTFAKK